MNSDPFSAFGNDDDDGELASAQQRNRDAHNGVLSFHHGTEHALLLYVQQQQLQQERRSAQRPDGDDNERRRRDILRAVDQFCTERHWMMHVGPDKGVILQDFLRQQLQRHRHQQQQQQQPFILVELGTYCGYSTIRMADAILPSTSDFHIFTVDINPQTQAVAKRLVELAGLSEQVTFVLLPPTGSAASETALADELRAAMGKQGSSRLEDRKKVDFLFVDHAKELYLADLQQLEKFGYIQAETAVAADNVVFFQLDDYRHHMSCLQDKGVVSTELVSDGIFLEYVQPGVRDEMRHANDPNLSGPPNPDSELRDGLGTRALVSLYQSIYACDTSTTYSPHIFLYSHVRCQNLHST